MLHGLHVLDAIATDLPPLPPIRLWDCGVTWRDLNPKDGTWEWERLDAAVSRFPRPLLVLGATPQWAARSPNLPHYAPWLGPGSNSAPKEVDQWDRYVREVGLRYKGRIQHYQVWNEPQLADFWFPYADVPILAKMTSSAHRILKSIDPKNKIVAAPVLPRPSSGGMARAGLYLANLRKCGWPVDVFDCHIYPEIGKGPRRFKWMLDQVQQNLRLLGAPTRPLWVTESNYNLLGGPLPDWKSATYLRATNRIAKRAGVERIYWYAYSHPDPKVLGIPFHDGSTGLRVLNSLNAV